MHKFCNRCQNLKSVSLFHTKKSSKDGLSNYCAKCDNEIIRERRVRNNNQTTKKYERTLNGKLVRTYRNMLSRVRGILKKKSHLYEGLDIIDKDKFYEWSLNDAEYLRIFKEWEKSGYDIKLSPSIDRMDSSEGYVEGNIRWLTFSENSANKHKTKKN